MNKEVHYEGWLIKSPPTKRIWRARWRRRWFTLKQGEIPEQFCLEYYTDRNCRKLKGVIDLDQCEQVDCGLRLENRKQKFQFMFDIKTPKRTYYLAADTEADMRDWVNCICQVCHLLDTKQSGELLQDGSRTVPQTSSSVATSSFSGSNGSNNTSTATLLNTSSSRQASFGNDIQLRRPIVLEQPQSSNNSSNNSNNNNNNNYNNNNNNNNNSLDCSYVNTEYSNRETLICDMHFDQQQLAAATSVNSKLNLSTEQQTSPVAAAAAGAIYSNSPLFGAKQQQLEQEQKQNQALNDSSTSTTRLAVNSNGVVRKIPENLVLSNVSLPDAQHSLQQQQHHQQQQHSQNQTQQQYQQYSVQPSPALSTASGPYIPISECFSGSPKLLADSNNPTTPLNNLDPKFYDTPRSHNNIGLNLTNDQSYSPKITNCSLQQTSLSKNRSHRSDSDSESVFTDDEEWAHPLPLRENVDRNTRPSDSSVENESFVLTYSQRFSKIPESALKEQIQNKVISSTSMTTTPTKDSAAAVASSPKVLKNIKNLILDIQENEKIPREVPPQLSDTENTSPAIGPRDATSVVEESYDIPRSHNLPYYNMGQLFEKSVQSPETNPIAASTPNIMLRSNAETMNAATNSPAHVRTLPRPHCYTNAAPTKFEGNVFRYDFIEQGELPPVNRKLKPKVNLEDKPPEEVAEKPPTTPAIYDNLALKFKTNMNIQQKSTTVANTSSTNTTISGSNENPTTIERATKPPSVDRKLKPNAYKANINPRARLTSSTSLNRSSGAPLSMVLSNENESYKMETRTLPRQPRTATNFFYDTNNETQLRRIMHGHSASLSSPLTHSKDNNSTTMSQQALQKSPSQQILQLPTKNEHKLQYFDLDVANPPQINRQSMSVGNLNAPGISNRINLSADPSARAPIQSGVVYNCVDFVKTEAFKRIREERKKESEGNNSNAGNTNNIGNTNVASNINISNK